MKLLDSAICFLCCRCAFGVQLPSVFPIVLQDILEFFKKFGNIKSIRFRSLVGTSIYLYVLYDLYNLYDLHVYDLYVLYDLHVYIRYVLYDLYVLYEINDLYILYDLCILCLLYVQLHHCENCSWCVSILELSTLYKNRCRRRQLHILSITVTFVCNASHIRHFTAVQWVYI